MKTKSDNKRINLITLGCSKNLVDSETLLKQLEFNNFSVQHDSNKESDIVIINTCGFINDAKQESIEIILANLKAKQEGLIEKVFVMGCLSERYKDDLKKEMKDIDGFYGVSQFKDILKDLGAQYKKELIGERIQTTPQHYAYLKISEGCDRNCSFCAIPLIRGKHISKPIEELILEAKNLVNSGVKELILIAQDLTYYGLDIYRKNKLGELLQKLSEIENLEWIRLHYTYPSNFPLDVIEEIRENNKVCKYVDIPLQHISDHILNSMKRSINSIQTRKLLNRIKDRIPGVALRTTLIIGYPGETDTDFLLLKNFVEEQKFDRLGVFAYSHEEDTAAYLLEDNVTEDIKQQRVEEIMALQESISLKLNEAKIGRVYKTIIDRHEGDYYIGRTEYDSPEVDNEVLINANENNCKVGNFYNIKINSANAFDLFGSVEN